MVVYTGKAVKMYMKFIYSNGCKLKYKPIVNHEKASRQPIAELKWYNINNSLRGQHGQANHGMKVGLTGFCWSSIRLHDSVTSHLE